MMQKLTTKEPDDAQLEVAIAAFLCVLEAESKQTVQAQSEQKPIEAI
jgi:uncharacterized protein YqhQ